MRLYLLDGSATRTWKVMLPRYRRVRYDALRGFIPRPQKGDVLICHGLNQAAGSAAAELARSGVYVIVISGGTQQVLEESRGLYYRRAAVTSPVDLHFARCFAKFQSHLEEMGEAVFELLEGEPGFSSLKAYCCAVLAGAPVEDCKGRAEDDLVSWTPTNPCVRLAGNLRQAVSHDFLERTVLVFGDGLLTQSVRAQDGAVAKGLRDLGRLLELLADGFNPAALVGDIPGLCLPEKEAVLRSCLQERFVRDSKWAAIVRDVRGTSAAFTNEVRRLAEGATDAHAVRQVGEQLQAALRLLPRVVWLP